jgi:hypothetical protein
VGEQIDLDVFTRSTSHLRRLFKTLGIERQPKDVTPTLAQYLEAARVANAGEDVGAPSSSADDESATRELLIPVAGPAGEGGGA